jgi:hypothetical protein
MASNRTNTFPSNVQYLRQRIEQKGPSCCRMSVNGSPLSRVGLGAGESVTG